MQKDEEILRLQSYLLFQEFDLRKFAGIGWNTIELGNKSNILKVAGSMSHAFRLYCLNCQRGKYTKGIK